MTVPFDYDDAPERAGPARSGLRLGHRLPVERPLVRLPTSAAIRDYLVGRQVPAAVADTASQEMPVPLSVTKRGTLILAKRTP